MELSSDIPVVQAMRKAAEEATGKDTGVVGVPFMSDSDILIHKYGIPAPTLGPGHAEYAHAADEHIDIKQLAPAAKIYALTALDLCNRPNSAL